MRRWVVVAQDHGRNEGQVWTSKVFDLLDNALLEAAWMQQRDALFGYDNPFTVVEVAA